jgi:tetratricopeptide (TPR) repeat protein
LALASSFTVPSGEAFAAAGLNARKVDACELPPFEREPEVATVRSVKETAPDPIPAAALLSHVRLLGQDAQNEILALALGDLSNPRIRLALAAALERNGLIDEAIDQYARLAAEWPDQPRLNKRMETLRSAPAARSIRQPAPAGPPAPQTAKGHTHALLIGISRYQQQEIQDLAFADLDAREFANYLHTPRAGLGPQDTVDVLLNEQATLAAIRNRMNALKTSAGKDDAVLVFAAGHGDMWQGIPSLITHRADRQYVGLSTYPMDEFQKLLDGRFARWGKAMIFLDICHSGHIAQFSAATPQLVAQYLMMMAANPTGGGKGKPEIANAYEDPVFGGGHGAFTYFLLRALNTREAAHGDLLSAPELWNYVQSNVSEATLFLQNPTSVSNMDRDAAIADLRLPGLPTQYNPLPDQLKLAEARLRTVVRARGRSQQTADAPPASLPAATPGDRELEQRIDLENRGDAILLAYLRGEENPLTEADFASGASLFRQALALQPGSPYLFAREEFCDGRRLVFRKQYPEAIARLERSIRLDPAAAFAYNALGIAYLQQARYADALRAFEDAIGRAPRWAYPVHNMALAQTQLGDYEDAIASYKRAMLLAPAYSYLAYNLGLTYQKINRIDEARQAYERARALSKTSAAPEIALGLLAANDGQTGAALEHYHAALDLLRQHPDPMNLSIVQHNEAALLARKKKTREAAVALWRKNIADSGYLPSRIGLAGLLAEQSRKHSAGWQQSAADAAVEYRAVLKAEPDSLSSRLELAALLTQLRDETGALRTLDEGDRRSPDNAAIYEGKGDVLLASGNAAGAREAWRRALDLNRSPEAQARILRKLRKL